MNTFPNISELSVNFLQVEPCDDSRGNDVSDILHNGDDTVTDSGVTTVKPVSYTHLTLPTILRV